MTFEEKLAEREKRRLKAELAQMTKKLKLLKAKKANKDDIRAVGDRVKFLKGV